MNHRIPTFLGLMVAIAVTTALASALAISITPPGNDRESIVIAFTSAGAVGSRRSPSVCLEAKNRLDFRITDLPAGIYAVVEYALRD